MTSCNRTTPTYFTLDTISKSLYKNIQVILVDDSTIDPIMIQKLNQFNIHIELIQIQNKFWINPCVNYNIGFKHIKGGKIIIQNAEVCHIGDAINYVIKSVADNEYHVFDVYALQNINCNNELYSMYVKKLGDHLNLLDFQSAENLHGTWYQHSQCDNRCFHFLSSMTRITFDKIKEFDIDYSIGIEYDDNDFIFRIRNNHINIISITDSVMGIHQWHGGSAAGTHSGKYNNDHLHYCKMRYFDINKSFLKLTSYDKNEFIEIINEWIG